MFSNNPNRIVTNASTYNPLLKEQSINKNIETCSFVLSPCLNKRKDILKIGGYKVRICFYSDLEKQQLISEKKILILPSKKPVEGKKVYDVFSLNGIASSDVKKLLNEKNIHDFDVSECEKLIEMTKDIFLTAEKNAQTLFVMDLKDFPTKSSESLYANKKGCIKVGEQKFINFLKSGDAKASENAKRFRGSLMNLPVDYVILEGSLKSNFLEAGFLTQPEKDFFQTKGTGSQSFCQFIEFFMNAFKRGEKVILKKNRQSKICFEGEEYIKKISETTLDYQPVGDSITLYPSSYQEIAEKGLYTKAMQNSSLFSLKTITHQPNHYVEMHTTKKRNCK
jgi:hypothetical protein